MNKTKYCKSCDQNLPLTSFAIDRASSTGLQFYCKGCLKAKAVARVKANRDKWATINPHTGKPYDQ